jgi:hypothetical protein
MYFLHTVQKVISRWGSRVLQRFIDFKTQTKLFNIFFIFATVFFFFFFFFFFVFFFFFFFFTFSMNLFFTTYCYNFKRIQ